MKLYFVSAFLLIATSGHAGVDFVGQNQKKVNCIQLYNTYLAAKNVSHNYGKAANDCKLACQRSTVGFNDPTVAANYEACSNGTGGSGAGVRCDANSAKVADGTTYDIAVWTACASDCAQAISETTNSDIKKKYSSILDSCNQKAASQAPVEDPNGDMQGDEGTGDTVAEDDATDGEDTGGLEPADTGNPNQQALNSLLQGSALDTSTRTPIDGGGVDFTGGGRGGGSYSDAAGGSGPTGFAGSNVVPPIVLDDTPPQFAAAQNPGAGGAGGGPLGGAGAPGGGAGMGAGGAGAPARPGGGGGGPRTSIAGAQLGKVGQNVFWAGSGGGATGSSGSTRKTAATNPVDKKEKKTLGPSYLNKGTGDGGLLRLFRASTKSNEGTSQSCNDNTVFCTHENYFIRVDRYPNSDINPNSGSK